VRTRLTASIVASLLIVLLPHGSAAAAPRITANPVVGNLDSPVAFTFGPGKTLWYVEKTTGEIRVHDLDTGSDRSFFTVSGVNGDAERGMLGIALHPRYPSKPFVYVYVTRSTNGSLRNQILRLRDTNGSGGDMKVIFNSPASSSPYHNGGRILFGPDGTLYAIVGEGHDPSNSQELTNNDRGKILRMTPNGGVPATNPRSGSRMWAFGIRNSFGFAFDPANDRLWESENGPECNDEVNLILKGRNYGWGPHETCSGSSPGNTNQDGPRPVRPKLFYVNPIGITGIAFCERCGLGGMTDGRAFIGAVNTGDITRVTFTGNRRGISGHRVVYSHNSGVLSLELGPSGSIFFSDFGGIFELEKR
jgi:glucose/arabinose dehydrogenase